MRPNRSIFALLVLTALTARADLLNQVNDTLSISDTKNQFQLQLSGLLDLESYYFDQPAPGFIYTNNNFLFNPRLTIFLDAQWTRHFYAFVQTRIDRGFDPSDQGAQIRADEYFFRFTPFDDSRINFQIGKFATVVGNWVPRHLSWDNPFINAPLPYQNQTGLWYLAAPEGVDDLLHWAHIPTDEYGSDFGNGHATKRVKLPVIWEPSYATGLAVTGTIGKFDYATEIKNASLSSPPQQWSLTQRDFDYPTFSGRIGYRPDRAWNFGVSASGGPYLADQAAPTLPPDRSVGDYREFVLGQDASFAWHHFQFWAEFFEARFQIPGIGNGDTFTYYLEGKYKITPQLFVALRWNQQLFSTVRDEESRTQWGPNTRRVDAAVGYRFTDYLQAKVQYSFTDTEFEGGNNLVGAQITLKF